MKTVFLALGGAALSVLAFPPVGPGLLVIPGIALFLIGLRLSNSSRQGFWIGGSYGLAFFGGLMWWLANLELLALVLIPVQALFFAAYGWWLTRRPDISPVSWVLLATGGWAIMEIVRYRFPVGGQEWGAAGYALSDGLVTRLPAALVGTSGLTVLVVLIAAELAVAATGRSWRWALISTITATLVFGAAAVLVQPATGPSLEVAIVQGSTPCPFERCPPDERLRTFEQHLALTDTIQSGEVSLVVWPESSTGSTNADPVLNENIRDAIAGQARRIGAPILVGGDRVVSDSEFINANVLFDADGSLVGEYRKQHPVPFGEYIPARPLFAWIPALDRVPRDMVRGEDAFVFDLGEFELGSVISWEGGFARYARQNREAGADLLVVATNKASYGPDAPTSDQFMGMTRMRAVELGVPVIHAAVTGKSTVIDSRGGFDATTETGSSVVFYGTTDGSHPTLYASTGDLLVYLAAFAGLITWLVALVSSRPETTEED